MRIPRVFLLLVTVVLAAGACGGSGGASSAQPGQNATPTTECAYPASGTAAKQVDQPPAEVPEDLPASLTLTTSAGDIAISFDTTEAPCTVNSFVSLAKQGWFDDTVCHRLTTQGIHVLQCGDPTGFGTGGPGYRFDDEVRDDDPRLAPCEGSVCTYGPGAVAMANAGPNTNGSQFFLVYDASPLPPAYTVFGHLDAAGLKVVSEIAANGTLDGSPDGAPKDAVRIRSVA